MSALVQAHDLLERASSLSEIREIRDRAEALRHYCDAAGRGLALQNQCASLKLRAERKAGELLAEMPKNPGGRSTSDTLSGVGVDHHQSSRWQRVASVPDDVFEAHVADYDSAASTSSNEVENAERGAVLTRFGAFLRQPLLDVRP